MGNPFVSPDDDEKTLLYRLFRFVPYNFVGS
jgi:hypothetical protein